MPFSVSYVFPLTAAYSDLFNEYILRVQQSGLMAKLLNEFKWEVERSAGGKLLQVRTASKEQFAMNIFTSFSTGEFWSSTS